MFHRVADSLVAIRTTRCRFSLMDDYIDLLKSPTCLSIIERESEKRLPLLSDYLRSLDLGAGGLTVVDVGWRGHQARLLDTSVRDATGAKHVHFHFGGYDVDPSIDLEIDMRRFAFDDRFQPLPFQGVANCVELFVGSGAARARGYERGEDGQAVTCRLGSDLLNSAAMVASWVVPSLICSRCSGVHPIGMKPLPPKRWPSNRRSQAMWFGRWLLQ